jgi:hypothetical protein
MEEHRSPRFYELFVNISVYPLVGLIMVMAVSTCAMVAILAFRQVNTAGSPPVTNARRLVPENPAAETEPASQQAVSQNQTDAPAQAGVRPIRRRRSPAPPNLITRLASALTAAIYEPTPRPRRLKIMPTPRPTPTSTPSATPTTIPSPTFSPVPTQRPTSVAIVAVYPTAGAIPVVYPTGGAIPVVYPTGGALPAANSGLAAIPIVYPTPGQAPLPTVMPVPSPESSATPTLTPLPQYDFMLAEFYNSPTTNSFLMIYVAIVDPREIPIGGMKIVGTRLDHNLTYESPLSTWHHEGYSAPGKIIKSGNVKFEPPGGIETAAWTLYLADAHGNRVSEDVPFNVDQNDKQWYFVKFRRRF